VTERLAGLIPPDPQAEFPFEVSEYLIQAIHRIARVRDAEFETVLAPLGLNVTRYRTLLAIVRAGRCSMSDLSVLIGYDRTTLARAIDHLVAADLVRREGTPTDRRFVQLVATGAGEALYERSIPIAEAFNARFFAGVPEDEQRKAMRVIELLLANLGVTPQQVADNLSPRWN
jgi:DNA-binding MarR family transcriptional regulator